jgi:hypothetical protein
MVISCANLRKFSNLSFKVKAIKEPKCLIYNKAKYVSIKAKLQPVTAKTMKISII